MHSTQGFFFPSRGFWGNDHKEKGVYVRSDELELKGVDGQIGKDITLKFSDLHRISHFAKFEFFFLIVAYSVRATNTLIFSSRDNRILASIPIAKMSSKSIINMLQHLKVQHQSLQFDQPIGDAVAQTNFSPINSNYWREVWLGVKWWLAGAVLFIAVVLLFAR
jgi:hypothetical protein